MGKQVLVDTIEYNCFSLKEQFGSIRTTKLTLGSSNTCRIHSKVPRTPETESSNKPCTLCSFFVCKVSLNSLPSAEIAYTPHLPLFPSSETLITHWALACFLGCDSECVSVFIRHNFTDRKFIVTMDLSSLST